MRPAPQGGGEDLGRQAGAAHAEQHHVARPLGADLIGEALDPLDLPRHGSWQVEPAQPVGDLSHGFLEPDRRVLGPEPAAEPGGTPLHKPRIDRRAGRAQIQNLAV